MKRQSQEPEISPLSLFAEWQQEKKQARKSAAQPAPQPQRSTTAAPVPVYSTQGMGAALALSQSAPTRRVLAYRDPDCAGCSIISACFSPNPDFTVMVELLGVFEGGKQIA